MDCTTRRSPVFPIRRRYRVRYDSVRPGVARRTLVILRWRHCGAISPFEPGSIAYVPVGRYSAVLVRCLTTHFDLPANASASARSRGGHVVGQPSATETRWV